MNSLAARLTRAFDIWRGCLMVASFLTVSSFTYHSRAAEVHVSLSSRESYVNAPIVLQIAIVNAEDYIEPKVPDINGCVVSSFGTPSQSSRMSIINGRRSVSKSIVFQFQIIPLHPGEFEIPPISVEADGRSRKTEPLRFVATKSETGDLLFVEIQSSQEKVFVGEALVQKLRIWIKPFRSSEYKITLSEENMWNAISDQSSWGGFGEQLSELLQNGRRPGGQEVLRKDSDGMEHSYFLYEIEATLYPKRPGKIDANDVRVVVDYPIELAQARDPFAAFGGSAFGNSPLSQMFEDDFFSAPFGRGLAISKTRPVVAEAQVGMTQVVPIPTKGRPADYRGAVGSYKIITHATPSTVKAGDPITLNIGIDGTGPMELVQAPPLTELEKLTKDFKVADDSLAGFVQDETKVFATTIRPLREGIAQIPSIPFSFFNPETEEFETAFSDPIAITVGKSDSLALDSIVVKSSDESLPKQATEINSRQPVPDLTNDNSLSILVSQSETSLSQWVWFFVLAPAFVWIITFIVLHRQSLLSRIPSFKSARQICIESIDRSRDPTDVELALVHYISRRTKQPWTDPVNSVGALRTLGLYQIAVDVETFFQRREPSNVLVSSESLLADDIATAKQLVQQLEIAFEENVPNTLHRSKPKQVTAAKKTSDVKFSDAAQRLSLILLTSTLLLPPNKAMSQIAQPDFVLTPAQRETVLQEAGEIYLQATNVADVESIQARSLFATAAEKYQLLVDSGIRNAQLYKNLGNVYLQSKQIGRAIANYERAKQLDRSDRQLAENLAYADTLLVKPGEASDSTAAQSWDSGFSIATLSKRTHAFNEYYLRLLGRNGMLAIMAVSSLIFWGLLIVRMYSGGRYVSAVYAIVPALLLVISLSSIFLDQANSPGSETGILVVDQVALHAGDGEQFQEVATLDAAEGQRIHILAQRGNWVQVKTGQGDIGWLNEQALERLF